jgi:hypothetical protein
VVIEGLGCGRTAGSPDGITAFPHPEASVPSNATMTSADRRPRNPLPFIAGTLTARGNLLPTSV